jgi:hypothetical protein
MSDEKQPEYLNLDVQDKESLVVYGYFRKRWLEMLGGEDLHGIGKQISNLLVADLEYHALAKAYQFSEEAQLGQSNLVLKYIREGFLFQQVFAIRRITEEYHGDNTKAVYSLPRVIFEMKHHRKLMTRENYVCVDGHKYEATRVEPGFTIFRHEVFDEISKVSPENRSRNDLIHESFFTGLRDMCITQCAGIRKYAGKLLAHAADPTTRTEKLSIRMSDFQNAYKNLIRVFSSLYTKALFGPSLNLLPTLLYEPLENISNPLCPVDKVAHLEEYWNERKRELEKMENDARGITVL